MSEPLWKTPLVVLGLTLAVLTGCARVIAMGYLEGSVTIGPLRPAERVGEALLLVPPEVYAAYPIKIFEADGTTWVADIEVRPNGTYRTALAPGIYVITLAGAGLRTPRARDLPKTMTITSGEAVRLDIHIDTGMR